MAKRVSNLLDSSIATVADGFERFPSRPGYWYRRFVKPLFSFIVVQHSTKYKCFEVSVASSVFASWDGQFGTHQLRRSIGLANLRVGSKMIDSDQVPYRYDADSQEALENIRQELQRFALPWFAAHHRELAEDPLVRRGLAEIECGNPSVLTLEGMKQALRDEAAKVAASVWHRKQTGILAADLLRWAAEGKLANGRS